MGTLARADGGHHGKVNALGRSLLPVAVSHNELNSEGQKCYYHVRRATTLCILHNGNGCFGGHAFVGLMLPLRGLDHEPLTFRHSAPNFRLTQVTGRGIKRESITGGETIPKVKRVGIPIPCCGMLEGIRAIRSTAALGRLGNRAATSYLLFLLMSVIGTAISVGGVSCVPI